MIFVFSTIESMIEFMASVGLSMNVKTLEKFLLNEEKVILFNMIEGGGIYKDGEKWIIYIPTEGLFVPPAPKIKERKKYRGLRVIYGLK